METSNIKNNKTCLNFAWTIDFTRWEALDKIMKGEKIGPEHVIPNFGNNEKTWDYNKYYLQDVGSWAKLEYENPVRVVYHFAHLESLRRLMNKDEFQEILNDLQSKTEIGDEEKSKIIENILQEKIQTKYNNTSITLGDIENKYIGALKELESQTKPYNENFRVLNLKDLVKQSDDKDVQKDKYLNDMINDKVCGIASLVDYLKLAINYYGFGYEKNLTIDLDHTPKSIGNGNNGEIDNFKYGLQFGKRTPIKTDKPGGLENQICFTENSKNIFLKKIIDKVRTNEQYTEYLIPPKQSSYSFIKDEIGQYIDTLEDAIKNELKFVSNCMLIGDKRKFLSVLITLKVI